MLSISVVQSGSGGQLSFSLWFLLCLRYLLFNGLYLLSFAQPSVNGTPPLAKVMLAV